MFITIVLLGLFIIVSFYYSRKPIYLPAPTSVVVEPTESLIGKTYFPVDNSYAVCLSDRSEYGSNTSYYLAGTAWDEQIECTIISQPFPVLMPVPASKNTTRIVHFVIVQDSKHDKTHCIMFHERGLKGTRIKPLYTSDPFEYGSTW